MQIRLWNDCFNNCLFCSIENKKHTKTKDKIIRINKVKNLKNNRIGIIGGEFFEGQLKTIENEWLDMINKISCNELFITANLIHEQYLLEETLNTRPDILICTSYDTIGRFKSDTEKENWLNRVNSIKNVFCTIIPTEDMIHDPFIKKIKCGINLCEPHLGINWLKKVDKKHYHENLIKDNKIFNLPKRRDLLKWLINNPKILNIMKNYKVTHFNNILSFNENNELIYEVQNRFEDNNFMAPCGHPYFSRCYADSNKCLICDIEEI